MLILPVGFAKAEMQEFNIDIDQMLTINIPDSLIFNIDTIDEEWRQESFQVGITTNNRTGYTFVSDVSNSLYNSQFGRSLAINDYWSITYPSGTELSTNTHATYPSYDNLSLDKKYNYVMKVKADSHIVQGTYTGSMTFYVVTNPYPETIAYVEYMQNITNDIVLSMTPGKYYQLKDSRDGKKYWIVLKDGELRMAQNLDYDISTSQSLTAANSNVPSSITLSNATITGGTLEESWDAEATGVQSYDEGVIYRPTLEDAYATVNSCVKDGFTEWECYRGTSGNYYNWTAAIAVNDSSSYATGTKLTRSICPKNWTLPETASEGYLSAIAPEDKNAAGRIRCEGIKPTHTINFIVNDYYGNSFTLTETNTAWGIASFVALKDVAYGQDETHELLGWSTKQKVSSPEYIKGDLIDTSDATLNLYAVWWDKQLTLDDIEYMQDITTTIIANTPNGTTKRLKDRRDGNSYWVTKFGGSDGDIWMTQNLAFNNVRSSSTTYYKSESDVLSDQTITYNSSAYDFYSGNYLFLNGNERVEATSENSTNENLHYRIGRYYSVYNGKLGNYGTNYLINTGYSVCPKGWGIPTIREVDRFRGYSGQKYIVKGGYITSKDIVTEEGLAARYLVTNYKSSSPYYYMADFLSSSTYTYSSSYVAAPIRCIARKDYNLNNPETRTYDRQTQN